MTFKRLLAGLLAMIVLATGTTWLFRDHIVEAVFANFVRNNLGVDLRDTLPDGLHVLFSGTGSPMPDPTRTSTCNGVIAGTRVFAVDIGAGGVRNLILGRFPVGEIERVYVTHLHSDRIEGLGETMIQAWTNGRRTSPLPVSGPEGVEATAEGFNMAFSPDRDYRLANPSASIEASGYGLDATTIALDGESSVVLDEGDLKVTAFRVSHQPAEPAFGYRFDYKDRSVVFSGDTAYDPNLVRVSAGADLLVHEALSARMMAVLERVAMESGEPDMGDVAGDVLSYHTTPEDAARAAQEAGVRELMLNHLIPPVPSRLLHGLFLGDAPRRFDGRIRLAEDGMVVSLPAGSDEVVHLE